MGARLEDSRHLRRHPADPVADCGAAAAGQELQRIEVVVHAGWGGPARLPAIPFFPLFGGVFFAPPPPHPPRGLLPPPPPRPPWGENPPQSHRPRVLAGESWPCF